jgi:MoxR-like ATPase
MKLSIDYPAPQAEREILALARAEAQAVAKIAVPPAPTSALLGIKEVFAARREVLELHLAPALEGYIVDLIAATRRPETLDPALAGSVRYGASPRGAIALERCARAHAWLAGRDYVSPADIQAMLLPVLGHRVLLSYEAEARGDTPDALLRNLMQRLPVP